MRDAAERQIVRLDMIVYRHPRQFRHQAEMSTDQPLDEAWMRQTIEAAVATIAGRGGKYQGKVAGVACRNKAPLQCLNDLVRRPDSDKAGGSDGVAGPDNGD